MKIFCLDTETSAGTRDGKVVQIAIVDDKYRQEWLINPESYIHPGCIAIHKITPSMVADKPNFRSSEAYEELMMRLMNDEVLVAHHAPFDISILCNEGVYIEKYICTCKVARKILRKDGVPRFGLQFLKEYLNLEARNCSDTLTGYAHSALYDTVVLYWLYKYLYEKIQIAHPLRDPNEVMYEITQTSQPVRTLGFGKYKGKSLKLISQIDIGYLRWLYESEMSQPPAKRKASLITGLRTYIS